MRCFFHAQAWWPSANIFSLFFTAVALNEGNGAAKGYTEFQDQIWSNNLIERFEEFASGVTSVDIITFEHKDGNQSAASAFKRVRKVTDDSCISLITSGRANPKFLTKAFKLHEEENSGISTSKFDKKAQAFIKQ